MKTHENCEEKRREIGGEEKKRKDVKQSKARRWSRLESDKKKEETDSIVPSLPLSLSLSLLIYTSSFFSPFLPSLYVLDQRIVHSPSSLEASTAPNSPSPSNGCTSLLWSSLSALSKAATVDSSSTSSLTSYIRNNVRCGRKRVCA